MPIDTTELEAEFEAMSRDVAEEAAGRWFSGSQEALYRGGNEHDYDVAPVAQAASPPQWDDTKGGFVFEYFHTAAEYFEFGTAPHEITPSQADVLAFEWPDAPPEIQEMFEDTFPTVFFPKVEVEGIEAIHYVERGRQQAVAWLEGQ